MATNFDHQSASGFEIAVKNRRMESQFQEKTFHHCGFEPEWAKFGAGEQALFGMDAEEGVGQALFSNGGCRAMAGIHPEMVTEGKDFPIDIVKISESEEQNNGEARGGETGVCFHCMKSTILGFESKRMESCSIERR